MCKRLVRLAGQRTQSFTTEEYLAGMSFCMRGYATALSDLIHTNIQIIHKQRGIESRGGRHVSTVKESGDTVPLQSTGKRVYDRISDMPQEGIATLKDMVSYKDTWHAGTDIKQAVGDEKALGLYVDLPKETVQEALPELYYHPDLTKAKIHQYNFGCTGAIDEFGSSGKHMCMYRESMNAMMKAILGSAQGERLDLMLDGWTGSGKSISLYALASAARQNGWVVMYVPSASLLIRGGVFKKKAEADSHWYTPLAATHILRGFYQSHSDVLHSIPSIDSKSSLGDECKRALESNDDFSKVDTAVKVLQGLLNVDGTDGIRSLVIIDDYNYLYHQTEYHETMHRFHRRRLEPSELVLASAFRLLQGDRKAGIVAAAPSYSKPISPKTQVPLCPDYSKTIRIPRFSMDEVSNMATMLVSQKKVSRLPPDASLKRALALTNGNAKELRQNRATLFSFDNGLENSVPPSHSHHV